MTAARRRWPWVVALLAAFAVGVLGGGYASDLNTAGAQQDGAGLAVMITGGDGNPASLGRTPDERLSLSLYNMGDSAVTVSEAHPVGWTVAADTQRTAPPRQWTTVPLSIRPDCDEKPADQVRLRVHGESTDEQLTLRVHDGGDQALARHSKLCGRPESTVTVEYVETERHDGELEMRVSVKLRGARDASRTYSYPSILEISGLRAEIAHPSLTLRSGEAATVTMRWTVERCAEIRGPSLVSVPVLAAVQEGVDTPFLSNPATAALARFSAEECAV